MTRASRSLAVVFALCLLASARATAQTDTAANVAPPAPGKLIDLGGYKLHLNCTGSGSPTVVLSAGAGDYSTDWALVQPKVASDTRVCSYDRSGAAWSDLGPSPRSIDQEVFDLHRLLSAGGEHPPFILVGQSLGGMVARVYATQYRQEIASVVLVDAYSEDAQLGMNGKLVRMRLLAKDRPIPAPRSTIRADDQLSAEQVGKIEDFIKQFIGQPRITPPFDRLPAEAQRAKLWAQVQSKSYASGDDYLAEISARVYRDTQNTQHPLGDLPLIVLSRSRSDYPPEVASILIPEHTAQQARMATLSTKGSRLIVPNSGHHIQLDAPDAVVSAIRTLVKGARQR